MTIASIGTRRIGALVFGLMLGLFGCAKRPEAPAMKQQVDLKIDAPAPLEEYDEFGWPIDRNRKEGSGRTQLHDDKTEELFIEPRERFFEDHPVMPREVRS